MKTDFSLFLNMSFMSFFKDPVWNRRECVQGVDLHLEQWDLLLVRVVVWPRDDAVFYWYFWQWLLELLLFKFLVKGILSFRLILLKLLYFCLLPHVVSVWAYSPHTVTLEFPSMFPSARLFDFSSGWWNEIIPLECLVDQSTGEHILQRFSEHGWDSIVGWRIFSVYTWLGKFPFIVRSACRCKRRVSSILIVHF